MLREVSIEILRKCPNNCLHCSSLSDRHCREIMDYSLFTSVIDDALSLGAKTICLSGGEPFLHPNIIDMASYIHQKEVECYIYTSGITTNVANNYAPISIDILSSLAGRASKLIFNIEAATEASYNKIMGTTGCFDIMKESVVNAYRYGLTTEAHFVPMRINIDEIEQVIELCQDLGVSKISFLRLVLHGRAQQNEDIISLNESETIRLKELLAGIKPRRDIQIRVGVPLSSNLSCHKCEAANGKLNIKYNGYVFPCEVFKNDRAVNQINGYLPENIREKSLKDIYLNSAYLECVRKASQAYALEKKDEACVGQYLIAKENL